ncbi:MAG: hypothetical protein NC132_02330 [Corallococcus sp.]|nr:hypothetical protein [Corallococcus sp.]MCM1358947.1 hypothetical protein [Corallococcus sp.]MCM1394935.1 hypothetical protein [Corallococcus sp.]
MKKSAITILLEWVCGNMFFDKNTPYAKAISKLADCDDFLQEQLKDNSELLEVYKKITDLHCETCINECDAYFKEGFSLGVTLGLEIAKYGE